ncbi:hypothetical protein NEFER03_1438 [Nematocida sp. LUAm3]|nr:hypothetical protein NEFER03_1438 [Nematocida sp. LUAm3]KAI5174732.1 hypothetical protein NEFER02_0842 [Nematocida sp. LUAm2]KAI5177857.1 hypothetical protein NEFER01_1059 [Nematocida sp. LUAm1]
MFNYYQFIKDINVVARERKDVLREQTCFFYLFAWIMADIRNFHLDSNIKFNMNANTLIGYLNTHQTPDIFLAILYNVIVFLIYTASFYYIFMFFVRFVSKYDKLMKERELSKGQAFLIACMSALYSIVFRFLQSFLSGIVCVTLFSEYPMNLFMLLFYTGFLAMKISNIYRMYQKSYKAETKEKSWAYTANVIKNIFTMIMLVISIVLLIGGWYPSGYDLKEHFNVKLEFKVERP